MEEKQEELKIEIGTEEVKKLEAKTVRIEEATIKEVGKNASKIVKCRCKHPDKEENILISEVKIERAGKLDIVALWVNKDSKKLLQKGSPLALFLQKVGATNISELSGKEVETLFDNEGYLCFKGY